MLSTGTDRPNVLLVLSDQQRWDSTGVHGNPLDLTPNFDRMARAGTHFTHAFTPQPVCTPARSALQTGQYPTSTGVFRNGLALPDDAPTIAEQFSAAGYDTAYIGKWHLAATGTDPVPIERRGGYEHWLASDVVELMSDAYDARLHDGDGRVVRLPGYRADAYIDAAIRQLAEPRERPLFMCVSLLEPHQQNDRDDFLAPTGYRQRYAGRWTPPDLVALGYGDAAGLGGYWGAVKRVDEAFGRLLDALRTLGHGDDTIVAYTSDHGCHFKTRNGEHKRSAHDSSIRIPLAIDGPGFRDGGNVDELVSLVDLPVTLLAAADVPVPDQMQGRSMVSLADHSAEGWPDDVFVQISESQVGRAIRTRRWKYSAAAPAADPWNDATATDYVDDLLYDLANDPDELTNLIGSDAHQPIIDELRGRLIERMVATGEPLPTIRPAAGAATAEDTPRDGR